MKVICTGNALSDLLLTPIHRTILGLHFGPHTAPVWRAEPGQTYTVYGIHFVRGFPFYFIELERDHWTRVPSVCFEIVDSRPSRLWRLDSFVYTHGREQRLSTRLVIAIMLEEPMFLQNLVDCRPREIALMREAATIMDTEFAASEET